jgi:hypothetical protein
MRLPPLVDGLTGTGQVSLPNDAGRPLNSG